MQSIISLSLYLSLAPVERWMRVKGLHDTCHRLDVFSTPFQQPRFSELWHALALPHVLFGGTVWVRGRRRLAFFLNPTPSQKRYGMRRYGTVYNVDPFDLYRHLHPVDTNV